MRLLKKFFQHAVLICIIGYPIYKSLNYFQSLNPIEKELSDFKFSDIYFSYINEKELDDDIFFVDIGVKDRRTTRVEISRFITYINKYIHPKVIALDVNFSYDNTIPKNVNEELVNALSFDNIVMSYNLKNIHGQWLKDKSEIPIDYSVVKEGFSNNLVEKVEYGVERFFKPYVIIDEKKERHFSLEIGKFLNKDVDNSLFNIHDKVMINFAYRYNDLILINDSNNYNLLKDKIVIVGLFTKDDNGRPLYNQDVHYTPSNPHYLGKSPPDMYGGEVIANIISNIKNDSFIKYYPELSKWATIILSILIYIILLYFMGKSNNIFLVSSLVIQFALVAFFIFLSILFIAKFNVYIDLTILAVITFLSVEFIGVIDEIIDSIKSWIRKYKRS
jgi:CHASE2 domain-containing sensor protein|tara:strand:+ start:103 stop:1269 length:1167 start_codon:yes stop_codon:yes gene_type:complete